MQTGLKLVILLPLPSLCWDYRHAPLCPVWIYNFYNERITFCLSYYYKHHQSWLFSGFHVPCAVLRISEVFAFELVLCSGFKLNFSRISSQECSVRFVQDIHSSGVYSASELGQTGQGQAVDRALSFFPVGHLVLLCHALLKWGHDVTRIFPVVPKEKLGYFSMTCAFTVGAICFHQPHV